MATKARIAALKSYPMDMLAEKRKLASLRWDADEVKAIDAEIKRRRSISDYAIEAAE